MKTHISFRLRKHLDADLIALNILEDELPELCRNGLRLMLGIRTTRQMEVKEKPLAFPPPQQGIRIAVATQQKEKTVQPPQRPAVFLPQHTGKPTQPPNTAGAP